MPNLMFADSQESVNDQEHEMPPPIPPKTTIQNSLQDYLPSTLSVINLMYLILSQC